MAGDRFLTSLLHNFWISPRPTPVSRSSCLWEAPLSLSILRMLRFNSPSNSWKVVLFVTPVSSLICCQTWSSEGLLYTFFSISRHCTSSPKGSLTHASRSVNGIRLSTVCEKHRDRFLFHLTLQHRVRFFAVKSGRAEHLFHLMRYIKLFPIPVNLSN